MGRYPRDCRRHPAACRLSREAVPHIGGLGRRAQGLQDIRPVDLRPAGVNRGGPRFQRVLDEPGGR